MLRISLKGLTKEWKPFIKCINTREKLPYYDRLWDDFIREELQDKDLHPKNKSFNEDMALVVCMKGKKNKDMSKVKCFNYGKMRHYSLRCLMMNKGDDEMMTMTLLRRV